MSEKIRVMVVDDSTVMRRSICAALGSDPQIDATATAQNGKIALQKLALSQVDVITLDVEMPELNGIDTLKEIKRLYPKIPVIMVSSLTSKGATTTLDALQLGAADYITKPGSVTSMEQSMELLKSELIPRVRELAGLRAIKPAPKAAPVQPKPTVKKVANLLPQRIEALAIGVSTGGPNALGKVIPNLPEGFNVPVFIVQHMPPVFTKSLADRLSRDSKIKVVEAEHGMIVQRGWAYIAPGDYHMVVVREGAQVLIHLNQNAKENSCRPAVDPLFRSIAQVYGAKTLACILTGMGNDGLKGAEVLSAAGAEIIAQDKASSVVWGMPGAVTDAGLADPILPLGEIAGFITQRVAHRNSATGGTPR
jgi:two-component system, chemotaxis family, protein-glutamate methylesterase/glutaminase